MLPVRRSMLCTLLGLLVPSRASADLREVSSAPALGVHALAYYRHRTNRAFRLATRRMNTQPAGSTIIVGIGRGDIGGFAVPPSDNKDNGQYLPLGVARSYTHWPRSGTALYACLSAIGGKGHSILASLPAGDETTLVAVEVVRGGVIGDLAWSEVLAGSRLTSGSVTTSGPATLVAFWWGDGGAEREHSAVPDNGFVLVEALLHPGNLVQCAVATRTVDQAGTFDVTWTATPRQGAQLWLVAVQGTGSSPTR